MAVDVLDGSRVASQDTGEADMSKGVVPPWKEEIPWRRKKPPEERKKRNKTVDEEREEEKCFARMERKPKELSKRIGTMNVKEEKKKMGLPRRGERQGPLCILLLLLLP